MDRGSNPLCALGYDEIDTVFGRKARENEEIRGLLNAGHRRGAVAGRAVVRGRTVTTEEIPAYCAVALAGIGELPEGRAGDAERRERWVVRLLPQPLPASLTARRHLGHLLADEPARQLMSMSQPGPGQLTTRHHPSTRPRLRPLGVPAQRLDVHVGPILEPGEKVGHRGREGNTGHWV